LLGIFVLLPVGYITIGEKLQQFLARGLLDNFLVVNNLDDVLIFISFLLKSVRGAGFILSQSSFGNAQA
jgi:hypothetical protein